MLCLAARTHRPLYLGDCMGCNSGSRQQLFRTKLVGVHQGFLPIFPDRFLLRIVTRPGEIFPVVRPQGEEVQTHVNAGGNARGRIGILA